MNLRIRQSHFLALILMIIAIFTFVNARALPELASDLNIIGASFLPTLLACFLGGMSIFLFFDRANQKYLNFRVTQEAKMVLLFMAMLLLYIYAMTVIGFEISSFVFLVLTMMLLGLRKGPVILGIATVLPTVVYVIFVKMMYIPIPTLIQGL